MSELIDPTSTNDEVDKSLQLWRSRGFDLRGFSPEMLSRMTKRLEEERIYARAKIAAIHGSERKC
jgi:hypothetical protein